MNKLLTTITLLCFSVAANADVWFCETVVQALLDDEGGSVYDTSPDFIIDTDQGFRILTPLVQVYRGSCRQTFGELLIERTPLIFCEWTFGSSLSAEMLIINVGLETFTYTELLGNGGFGKGVSTASGTCVKA